MCLFERLYVLSCASNSDLMTVSLAAIFPIPLLSFALAARDSLFPAHEFARPFEQFFGLHRTTFSPSFPIQLRTF